MRRLRQKTAKRSACFVTFSGGERGWDREKRRRETVCRGRAVVPGSAVSSTQANLSCGNNSHRSASEWSPDLRFAASGVTLNGWDICASLCSMRHRPRVLPCQQTLGGTPAKRSASRGPLVCRGLLLSAAARQFLQQSVNLTAFRAHVFRKICPLKPEKQRAHAKGADCSAP